MLKKFILLGMIPLALVLMLYATTAAKTKGKLEYTEHLSEVAVIVDGEEITLYDMAFYVLYQESKVEEQARIYNPDSPKDYWNAHTNGTFLQAEVKSAILGMAIHDKIMYNLALENNTVLSSDDKELMESARTEFWSGLYEGQLEKLPLSFEDGNRVIKEITLGQSYQHELAKEMKVTYAGLAWDGYEFEQMLKDHKVKVNDALWDRVIVGDISLTHTNFNYINGLTNEDKERIQENKKKNEWP